MATLVVIYPDGLKIGREFSLPMPEVIVGRDKSCAVSIDSDSVSRRHARIYFNGDTWAVDDLESTNGCRVNDMPVTSAVLRDGDFLTIGVVVFKFSAAGAIEIPSTSDDGEGGSGAPAVLGRQKPGPRN